jgi:hypothetical protein
MVLSMLLAAALWQKARDQLGYLLDPTLAPPRVSTSDGLIAAMLFFVAQAVTAAVIIGRGPVTGKRCSSRSRLAARSPTHSCAPCTRGPRRERANHPRWRQPASAWACSGPGRRGAGILYLFAIDALDLLESAMRAAGSYGTLGLWMLPLALVAAPLFEEFIFRGLIFGGLRRSFGVWPATLASAALFAIVHPAFSIIPVFILGACAALVYERSRSLLAPMIVHAVYNACVIGAQTFLL